MIAIGALDLPATAWLALDQRSDLGHPSQTAVHSTLALRCSHCWSAWPLSQVKLPICSTSPSMSNPRFMGVAVLLAVAVCAATLLGTTQAKPITYREGARSLSATGGGLGWGHNGQVVGCARHHSTRAAASMRQPILLTWQPHVPGMM